MERASEPHSVTLADSLKTDAGWEIFNFGYNGPNPPYVRIGMRIASDPLGFEPCFESFIRDKIFLRSKVSLEKHLRSYGWIRFDPIAFEEAYGRAYATPDAFPFGRWLRISRAGFGGLVVQRADATFDVPSHILCTASAIRLAKFEWLDSSG